MNSLEIKDNYYVTYGIFYLMGILTFVPNHFFCFANDYWMFKFRDTRGDSDPHHTGPPNRTPLQANFTSSFAIVCQVSFMVSLVVTAFYSRKLPPPEKRIIGSLYCMLVFFIINLTFVWINTDRFQQAFFVITLFIAVLLNLSSAVTMVSLFELVTKFPLSYYSAMLSGQALCGIFAALAQILTQTVDCRMATVNGYIYFGIGTGIVCCTIAFYTITKKNSKYFIYHIGNENNNNTVKSIHNHWSMDIDTVRSALHITKWYMGAMVFVLGSTAMIYPGLSALVVAIDNEKGTGNKWAEVYFVPVATFLTFNLWDFIGREIAGKIKKPRNAIVILIISTMRLGTVPLLMLCNAQPRSHMPVIFGDEVYIILLAYFGLSHGFLVNLCMITASKVARRGEKQIVTILTLLFSVTSVAFCSFLNLLLINLL